MDESSDAVTTIPKGFKLVASTKSKFTIIENSKHAL